MAGFVSSLVASVTGIKVVLFLAIVLAIVVWYLLKEIKQKEELRQLLEKAISGKHILPSEILKSSPVLLKAKANPEKLSDSLTNPIYKIVITGGPCGGKSTSLTKIQQQMGKKGFRVYSIPEIPTLVVQAGGMILMSKFTTQERIKFQSLLIGLQIYIEDYFTQLAQLGKTPSIIICDRGTVDPAAYVTKEEFQAIMDQQGWTWTSLRDSRYDGVIHLVTAALGAQTFYTRSNNSARSEGIELARSLDKKTLDAWTGHPHITVCPNVPGQSFDKKIEVAIKGVYKVVGISLPEKYESLIVKQPSFPAEVKVEVAENEEVILLVEDEKWSQDRIKRRGQGNSYVYQRKFRASQPSEQGYTKEFRVPLTALEYMQLKQHKADPAFRPITVSRSHFIIGSTHFSLDKWDHLYGREKTFLLRFANPQGEDIKKILPEWIEIEEDVGKDKRYELRNIARAQA